MEDNAIRTATEKREDNNESAVKMQDNRYDRKGQRQIRRRMRCGTATYEMWDNGDGEMGWKDSDGLGKYRQGMTTNLRAYRRSGITVMEDKVNGEDSGGQVRWRRCGTTGIDKAVEEMLDGKRRYVG